MKLGTKETHHQPSSNNKPNAKRQVSTRISSEQDSLSVSSTLSSLSACSSDPVTEVNNARGFDRQQLNRKPSDPPPDYDEADSGNADSDSEEKNLCKF